uniref:Uncharacterized protein n=1 Tax=Anopheles culicifacies TaxID=139723 RepID=A0A182MCD1_9DIPT
MEQNSCLPPCVYSAAIERKPQILLRVHYVQRRAIHPAIGVTAIVPRTHRSRYHRPRGLRNFRGLYLVGEEVVVVELKLFVVAALVLAATVLGVVDDVIVNAEDAPEEEA